MELIFENSKGVKIILPNDELKQTIEFGGEKVEIEVFEHPMDGSLYFELNGELYWYECQE